MTILKCCFLLMLIVCIVHFRAIAQNPGKAFGTIITGPGKKVAGASVLLLRGRDSATLKLSVANKEGAYSFENLPEGKYLVSVTAVGFKKIFSNPFLIGNNQPAVEVPALLLTVAGKSLSGVTVTADRPLIEQRIDRMIVNVDASITNTGSSALEVLEKAPGVTVDREGNISLKGKEGVMVLVDGRPTQLGAADLANMLRNMNSSQVDQLEIMTNPPARYDAAGNAGIINIKTKKIQNAGLNGSATASYIQGRYPKTNEGLTMNYRKSRVNLFGNLGHNYRKSFETLSIQRNIYKSTTSELENYFDQRGDKLVQGNAVNARAGMDFFANKRTTVGFVLGFNSSSNKVNNKNGTNILTSAKELESVTLAGVSNESDFSGFSTNLNFRRLLNNKGRELTADIDYLNYGSTHQQFMVNSYFDGSNNFLKKADSLKGHLPQDIKVTSGRVDYIHPLKNKLKFEAGIKSSIVETDNNARYDSIQYGVLIQDVNRSNHFVYRENINAAYINLGVPLSGKWAAQFGLRAENTHAKGRQLTTGENFDRLYTQLFPTVYFQYKANDKNTFVANFGRRVRRPNYESLNPFIKFIDRYTYSRGNPNLRPQLSNNVELTHTYRNALTTTLNYTSTTDIINNVLEQKGQEAYSTPANIASQQQVGLAISANTPVQKWWTSNINLNVFNNNFSGIVNNIPIDFSTASYIINTTQQFKINKTLTGELSGRFRSGWLEGVIKARPVGFVGAGFSQQVMKTKGVVRLTFRDIFYTQKFRATSRYGNVDFKFQEINDSRLAVLGFTYRFSKGKKLAPIKRTAGSANEEQDRIGNQ